MSWTRRTFTILGAAVAALALLVGAGAAIAAGSSSSDSELTRVAQGIRQHDAFETAVAKELGTTAAKLDAAITGGREEPDRRGREGRNALARRMPTCCGRRSRTEDHLAMRIAEAADVAAALGTTEAKLNAAYAKAQKAQALARVDQAEKDELITKKVADEMRARIAATTFPGFAAGGFGRGGHGGHGGFGHGGPGDGAGLGPMGGMPGGLPDAGQAPASGSAGAPTIVL